MRWLLIVVTSVAVAEMLYDTAIESVALGTVNRQDAWVAGNGNGTSADGMAFDDGTGNQAPQVHTGADRGDQIRRASDAAATRRRLVVTLRVQTKVAGNPFWFMDALHSGACDPGFVAAFGRGTPLRIEF